jgi:hypothetical protein
MLSSCSSWKSNATKRLLTVAGICLTTSLFVYQLLAWFPGHRTAVVQAAGFTICLAGPPTCNYATIQDAMDAAHSSGS